MLCIKCKKEIPDGSVFCNFCGRKQTPDKRKARKRPSGSGTIKKDTRNPKRPWTASAPSTRHGMGRVYLGAYPTYKDAQSAIEAYVREGRPELYGATVEEIYKLWSETHFKRVSESAVRLYTSMWKRFEPLYTMKMADIRTEHFQQLVNACTSKSAADTVKAMAVMLCRYAMQNDVLSKNYAEFVKPPKFEKKEKLIFSREQIAELWEHSDDKRVQIILVLIYTGMRIGELAALKPSDIHLDDGYLICGEKTDAGRNRVVPLPKQIPELSDFLRGWMQDGKKTVLGVSIKYLRNCYFYGALVDLGMIEGTYSKKTNQYTIAGSNHLTPHSARHTFASLCASAGMQPENLQKIIGHANFTTTADVYIHKDFAELAEEMAKIKR